MSSNLIESRPMNVFRLISTFLGKTWDRVKKNKVKSLIAVVLVIAGAGIYRSTTAQPKGLETAKVTRTTLTVSVTANGQLEAKKSANLKFYSPGRLAWMAVKQGDQVRSWQGVAGLDTIALNAAYQQALNNYRNYQATADKVLDDVKNHENDEDFATRATRTTAEVSRDNAYDAVTAAKDALDKAVLVSPIAGTVTDVHNLTPGLNLTGSDVESRYIRVVDLNSLYFAADVDEIDYGKVKTSQEAEVSLDAFPGQTCKGEVTYLSRDGQETSGGVVTFRAEIKLSDCNQELAVALNGQANLITDRLENVLVIPKKYLVTKNGENQVWVQTGDSPKARKPVTVTVGVTTPTEAEITGGLAEGDIIVFTP